MEKKSLCYDDSNLEYFCDYCNAYVSKDSKHCR